MTIVIKYQVEIDGKPIRFFINSRTKQHCVDHDRLFDQFPSEASAQSKAERWSLNAFKVVPVRRDIGTPVSLAELGF